MHKILILMSNTGGGHRASAAALKEAFEAQYSSETSVAIIDAWMEHTPWPLKEVPRSYEFFVDRLPRVYETAFKLTERPALLDPILNLAARFSAASFTRVVQQHSPDLLISVHPLMQAAPLQIMARWKRPIPLITVVTDLASPHSCWFHRDVMLCFVPNAIAYEKGLSRGLRPDHLRQCGLPLRMAFSRPPQPKAELRRALGMEADLPAALLLGGGEGMGPVGKIAESLANGLAHNRQRNGPAGQLVVICGRNQELRDRLAAMLWPIPTRINGFVNNMADWMAACDCLISKAGPGAIAEAMSRGLPILLYGFIPGQETGNVRYVTDNGVGIYQRDPAKIAETVSQWFSELWAGEGQTDLARMSQKARTLADPGAALTIAADIFRAVS